MRILLRVLSFLLIVSCFTFGGCGVDSAVVKVNGDAINSSLMHYYMVKALNELRQDKDFASQYSDEDWAQAQQNKGVLMTQLRSRAVDLAVKDAILYDKAKSYGIVNDGDFFEFVNNQLNMIKSQNQDGQFEKILHNLKITEDDFKELLMMDCAIPKLESRLSEDDTQGLVASKDAKRVSAKHILILVDENCSDEDAQKKMNDILLKIEDGASFDELMNQYSQDPGLANYPGGYVFGRGVMVKEFEDVAFSLEMGQVSDLVKTDYGYHLIKRTGVCELEDKFVKEARVKVSNLDKLEIM